jgi:hypothetical protein
VHALAEAHDTPFNTLNVAPAGTGTDWRTHCVPFHRSANGTRFPEPLMKYPTAVHAVADVQETAEKAVVVAPAGLGVALTVQVLPFHRSANGRAGPEESLESPTAMHAVAVGHDTARNAAKTAPVGLGVDWTDQLVPFQRSAKVLEPVAE